MSAYPPPLQRHAARPPRATSILPAALVPLSARADRPLRALIVDLNNFASFPTLAIGMLVASLRNAGHEARVLSPLAYDVPAVQREHRETWRDHAARRIHLSTWRPMLPGRDLAREVRAWWNARPDRRTLAEVERSLDEGWDVVLLSAYLQHQASVRAIAARAARRGVPVLLGGPMFNVPGTADAWRKLPGITAVVGAEVDRSLPDMLRALVNGATETSSAVGTSSVNGAVAGQALLRFDGVMLPDGRRSPPAAPLRDLSSLPVPDFTDFPWNRYRLRVVPVMTGRGCQWARCNFCSDVVSANGRTFRTRSVDAVLQEMREQSRRHQTTNFVFLDIKLNSNPGMLRGIADGLQHHVPGAQWVGTVHVDERRDNGLSARELRDLARSGMRRISFGLESGSQRLLDAMDKGCNVEANARFLREAHEAGLSVRCTMFKGYPGETADDLELTASFLEQHGRYLDRVRFNEFSVPEDTPIYEALRKPEGDPARRLRIVSVDHRIARARYVDVEAGSRAYRRAKARVLRAVYEINRREVRSVARAFDGLM